jgi:hypothetical protein
LMASNEQLICAPIIDSRDAGNQRDVAFAHRGSY